MEPKRQDGRGGFCYLQFGLPLGVYSGLAWLHDDPSYTIELQGTYEVSENDVYTTDLADISTLHLAKNISLRESMAFNVCSCYGIHRVTGYTLRAEMTNANKSMTVRRTAEVPT
ncbi:hypothetical protein ONE63_005146 [Megalurothrips usitatus]|uniref:Uncharacterized protein n=1 Tax=Megalurothrips usitatus TaxID=439358 RepID=A0AAV7Y1T8_9NEOP|nr:hypothetical protein ONE63_005146 [Megalurothrips usitatus]